MTRGVKLLMELLWKSIRNFWSGFSEKLSYNVKDEKRRRILFWEDNWLGIGSLKQLYHYIFNLNRH